MFQLRHNLMAVATAALLATGCASAGERPARSGFDDGNTTIRVTNNNWSDMTIYLVRHGTRQRLGMVTSQGVGIFRVPAHAVESASDVRLIADPIGSSVTYASEPIMISPGQEMEWRLENAINLSSFWVR